MEDFRPWVLLYVFPWLELMLMWTHSFLATFWFRMKSDAKGLGWQEDGPSRPKVRGNEAQGPGNRIDLDLNPHLTLYDLAQVTYHLGKVEVIIMHNYSPGICCSVTQSCLTLCDPNCSMPGFPVLHHLLEFSQTHICWVSDAIQPSHPLPPPSPPALNFSLHEGLFQ